MSSHTLYSRVFHHVAGPLLELTKAPVGGFDANTNTNPTTATTATSDDARTCDLGDDFSANVITAMILYRYDSTMIIHVMITFGIFLMFSF